MPMHINSAGMKGESSIFLLETSILMYNDFK